MAQNDGIVKRLRDWGENDAESIDDPLAVEALLGDVRSAADRIEALEEQVATAYQIVGGLADYADIYEHPDVVRAMDYLAYGKTDDGSDILPWPRALLNHKD